MKTELIVALDNMTEITARSFVEKSASCGVNWFKIGLELYSATGPAFVKELKQKGYNVFLDLKLHDIPNTVEKASRVIAGLGVDLLTIHCTGGVDMMKGALVGAQGSSTSIIGVTALTSLGDHDLGLLGEVFAFNDQSKPRPARKRTVARLYQAALEVGLRGIVCSPDDLATLPRINPSGFCFVTPGIRPTFADRNDQQSVATPAAAVKAGATHLVVGRPITAPPSGMSSEDAIKKILEEMATAGN